MHRPVLFALVIAAFCPIVIQQRLAARTQRQMPVLQVDPYWPQLPENWIIGVGAGVATDAETMYGSSIVPAQLRKRGRAASRRRW